MSCFINIMLILAFLISFNQVNSLLDKLTSSVILELRTCLDKRSLNSQVLCDNRINNFLYAASLSIQEVYNLYEIEGKAKTSTSKVNGVQIGLLQLVASSMRDTSQHPNRAMYGYTKREGKSCWCSYNTDSSQFIQAGSTIPLMFYAVGTKGDPDADNWITSYRLQYSLDGYEWINYNDSYVFTGNTDRNTEVLNNLDPFVARSVRLVPISWFAGICTRIEFTVSKLVYDPLPPRSSKEILIPGLMTGLNFVPLSVYNPDYDHSRAHLDLRTNRLSQGFVSGIYDNNQWVIIAAYDYVWWHKISIQARGDGNGEYSTTISIGYTTDGIIWTPYKGSKTFTANYDKWSITSIELDPFFALAIKIYIRSYYLSASGRFEAYYTRS